MKKLIFIFCLIALSAANVEARPLGGPHPGFRHAPVRFISPGHHHGSAVAAGFVAGLVGGSVINYLTSGQPRTITATPSVYTSTTVYNTPTAYAVPTVVNTQVVYPQVQSCYTNTNIVTGAVSTQCTGIPAATQIITAN